MGYAELSVSVGLHGTQTDQPTPGSRGIASCTMLTYGNHEVARRPRFPQGVWYFGTIIKVALYLHEDWWKLISTDLE